MAISRRTLSISFASALILAAGAILAWFILGKMATNIEDRVTRRYQELAVRTLSQKALLGFESRNSTGGHFKFWHPDDVPCIKYVGWSWVREGNGGHTSGSWPAGDAVTCRDFSATTVGTPHDEAQLPRRCLPVLTVSHVLNSLDTEIVLAVARQVPNIDHPELLTGELTEDEQNEIIVRLDQPKANVQKFIETGALEAVTINPVSRNQCKAFDLYRYNVEVNDLSTLSAKVPIGAK